mmetsp:Transcript_43987/g.121718  ORF Transcript_43987/g.121718 Transcript_43987/m.121718 type:complete len:241 (-) Transcript_43987:318-1040(-)
MQFHIVRDLDASTCVEPYAAEIDGIVAFVPPDGHDDSVGVHHDDHEERLPFDIQAHTRRREYERPLRPVPLGQANNPRNVVCEWQVSVLEATALDETLAEHHVVAKEATLRRLHCRGADVCSQLEVMPRHVRDTQIQRKRVHECAHEVFVCVRFSAGPHPTVHARKAFDRGNRIPRVWRTTKSGIARGVESVASSVRRSTVAGSLLTDARQSPSRLPHGLHGAWPCSCGEGIGTWPRHWL